MSTATDNFEAGFSIDGPHSPERTIEVADLAAAAARYLCHATLPERWANAVEYPAAAYRVIGHVDTLAARLDQVLDQLAQLQRAYAADPRLERDQWWSSTRPDPLDGWEAATIAGGCADDLTEARQKLRDAAAALQRAAGKAARLKFAADGAEDTGR